MRRFLRILLLQLLLWPLALLAAEGAFRVYLKTQGKGYEAEEVREETLTTVSALANDLPNPGERERPDAVGSLLHPYVGYGPEYMLDTQAREWHRTRTGKRNENEYLILLVGGSVAGGFGNFKSAGVGEFTRLLEEDGRLGGRPIRFLPYGYGGFKQPQQINLVQYLISIGIVPDAVINLDGFNEVALTMVNGMEGVSPTYPTYAKWTHRVSDWGSDVRGVLERAGAIQEAKDDAQYWADWSIDRGLHRSALAGTFLLSRVNRASHGHSRATEDYLLHLRSSRSDPKTRGPLHPENVDLILETSVRVWEECSRSLHALCEARGIFYFHVLQPTLHDVGSKPVSDEERKSGQTKQEWIDGAGKGYPLLREAGERLRAEGIAYYDASYAFEDTADTLYYDACHFNQKGNGILGRKMVAAFLEQLGEPR